MQNIKKKLKDERIKNVFVLYEKLYEKKTKQTKNLIQYSYLTVGRVLGNIMFASTIFSIKDSQKVTQDVCIISNVLEISFMRNILI